MLRSATPGFYTRKFKNRPRSLALIGRGNSGMHEHFQLRSKFCTPRGISSVAPAKLCQSQKFLPHECIPEKTPANQSASERPIFEFARIKARGRRPTQHTNNTRPSPPPRSPPRRPSPRAAQGQEVQDRDLQDLHLQGSQAGPPDTGISSKAMSIELFINDIFEKIIPRLPSSLQQEAPVTSRRSRPLCPSSPR